MWQEWPKGELAGQHIVVLCRVDQPGFQDHLHELFDKQRHPVGLGDHLLKDLRRERLAVCEVRHDLLHLMTS